MASARCCKLVCWQFCSRRTFSLSIPRLAGCFCQSWQLAVRRCCFSRRKSPAPHSAASSPRCWFSERSTAQPPSCLSFNRVRSPWVGPRAAAFTTPHCSCPGAFMGRNCRCRFCILPATCCKPFLSCLGSSPSWRTAYGRYCSGLG